LVKKIQNLYQNKKAVAMKEAIKEKDGVCTLFNGYKINYAEMSGFWSSTTIFIL
jgi:hypothetical protein